MVGQFTKNMVKFFVNLLLLVLILNCFIILFGDSINYRQAIINASKPRVNFNDNKGRDQSSKETTESEKKIIANQKLLTNKTIKITGSVEQGISQVVVFSSNNSDVYRTDVKNRNYQAKLNFSTPGTKTINIVALNDRGDVVDDLIKEVDIHQVKNHLIANVPYFYQYSNNYFPDSSCQNTAIAMLLKYYGWDGTPDQITKKFGKKRAQYAGGFSEVFNFYASNHNLNFRIKNNVNITPRYIESLIQAGKPVVAHGKFTGSGHIILLVGYDDNHYYAHDPAGKWDQEYKGDYKQRTATNGRYIKYKKSNLLNAMERDIGLWIHEVYRVDK
jgi:uncharacterized protein YvpB